MNDNQYLEGRILDMIEIDFIIGKKCTGWLAPRQILCNTGKKGVICLTHI